MASVFIKSGFCSLACRIHQVVSSSQAKPVKIAISVFSSAADNSISTAFFLYEKLSVISLTFFCELFAKALLAILVRISFLSSESFLFCGLEHLISVTVTTMAVAIVAGSILALIGFSLRNLEYYLALLEIKSLQIAPCEQIDLSYLKSLLISFPWGLVTENSLRQIHLGLKEIEKTLSVDGEIEKLIPDFLERENTSFLLKSFTDVIYKIQVLGQKIGLDYVPDPQKVCDEQVRIDSCFLRKEIALRSKSYTYKDLNELYPQVNSDTLKDMYKNMHRRIIGLCRDGQEKIDSYVRQNLLEEDIPKIFQKASINCGQAHLAHYNFLLLNLERDANFLDSSLIKMLEGDPFSIASQESVQLYTILYALDSASEAILETELFSEKEEMLLRFSASMRNCKRGRLEAIEIFYNYLFTNRVFLFKEAKRVVQSDLVKEFVFGSILVELANQFNGATAFVKKRTGALGNISELSHQSNFLKNLIGKQVGLKRNIEKDPYAYVLYSKVYGRNSLFTLYNLRLFILKNLESFYKYFTPKTIVEAIMREFNRRGFEEKYAMVEPVNLILERFFQKERAKIQYGEVVYSEKDLEESERVRVFLVKSSKESLQMQAVWELETIYRQGQVDYGSCLLTEYGAFALAQALGYIRLV